MQYHVLALQHRRYILYWFTRLFIFFEVLTFEESVVWCSKISMLYADVQDLRCRQMRRDDMVSSFTPASRQTKPYNDNPTGGEWRYAPGVDICRFTSPESASVTVSGDSWLTGFMQRSHQTVNVGDKRFWIDMKILKKLSESENAIQTSVA